MVHKSNKSINRVVIDIVDPKRLKPVEVSGREIIYTFMVLLAQSLTKCFTHSNEEK